MNPKPVPLVVDLDHTLIRTDLMQECVLKMARQQPHRAMLIPWWLRRGIAYAKCRIAESVDVDAAVLPYRREVLAVIETRRAAGDPVILATGTELSKASEVATNLRCFDAVIATTEDRNCTATNKLDLLREHLNGAATERTDGEPEFDYVGDDRRDVPLWHAARHAIGVEHAGRFTTRVPALTILPAEREPRAATALLRSLRPHQWVKNLLLFLPLLLAHRYADVGRLLDVAVGTIGFSLLVSATYIVNDLFDLDADRRHTTKRNRPLAAGDVRIPAALVAAAACALTGAGLLMLFPADVRAYAFTYVALTIAYSLYFKHRLMIDVVVLAGFYVLRILLGGELAGVAVSFWLLLFSMLFFLGIALVKRYSELVRQARTDRAYAVSDAAILSQLGLAAGIGSVLVLGLYIDGPAVQSLYRYPAMLWLGCPLLIVWIGRLWLLAGRGQIDEDPVLFSIRDGVTWAVGALAAGVVLLAR